MGRGPLLKRMSQKPWAAVTGRRVAHPVPCSVVRGPSIRVDNRIKCPGPPCIGSFGVVHGSRIGANRARSACPRGRGQGPCFSQIFNKDSIWAL